MAARGIDLPGLDLVIHADLPANSETLLHRSGRTGRAGSKGVSALIVTPAEFKKAQRLLQGAKVVAEWAKAPSADEVRARDEVRLLEHPVAGRSPSSEDERAMADAILARVGPEQAAAAFARLWREGRSAPEELMDASGARAGRAQAARGIRRRRSGSPSRSAARAGPRRAGFCRRSAMRGGITKDGIGAIRVQEDETFVQIAVADAGKFGAGMELEPGVTLRRIEGEPDLDAPVKPRAKPREAKPYEGKAKVYVPKALPDDHAPRAAAAPAPLPPSAPLRRARCVTTARPRPASPTIRTGSPMTPTASPMPGATMRPSPMRSAPRATKPAM